MGGDDKSLGPIRRRLCYGSILLAFFLTMSMLFVMQGLVYRFDTELMVWSLKNSLLVAALLLPPAFYAARRRFRPIGELWLGHATVGDQEAEAAQIERFPVFMAILVLSAVSLLCLESGMVLYLSGRMLSYIAINYIFMGLALGLAAAFLEFLVLQRALKPLRLSLYGDMPNLSGVPGVTIASRIVAMAVALTAISIVLGWTTAEVNSIHAVQDQVLERNRIHAKLLGDKFAGLLCAEASHEALKNMVGVERLSGSDYVELMDGDGNTVDRFVLGELDEESLDPEMMAEARSRAMEEPTANGSLSDRRGGLIAAYSPTGYYGMNLVSVVPLSPFLGMAWKVGLSFLFISLVIAAISMALAWLTISSFNRPLKRLVRVADEVGLGNLSLNIPVDSADEVGELSHAFGKMLGSLRGMIGNSKQTALLVMGEASDTYTTANDVSSSMGRVNNSVRYLSLSTRMESERLEKVKQLSGESTEATTRISRLIREIQKDARKSLECVEKSMERVEGSMARGDEGISTVDLYGFLLKTAELSGDISDLTQNAMEQNAITMRALKEIHSLAEDNAVSAEELYGYLELQSASMHRFATSSQKLAELAILLQAQTAEFITD